MYYSEWSFYKDTFERFYLAHILFPIKLHTYVVKFYIVIGFLSKLRQLEYVTGLWKITHMGANDTVNI